MKTIQNINEPARHDPVSPHQVAPWQHVEIEDNLDRRKLVGEMIAKHPNATADEIASMLAARQIHVSTTLVLEQLQRRTS